MNKLKDGRLITGIRFHDMADTGNEDLDLDLLADQLASIAGELRRGDARTNTSAGLAPNAPSIRHANEGWFEAKSSTRPHDASQNDRRIGFADIQARRIANAEVARQVYDKRRRRTALFGNAELFGEPAWDILLDLYIAHAEGKPVSVSSACIGSAAPPTTGLRWLGVLAENELVLREHDPEDQRRVLVRLTDRGIAAMDKYFSGTGPFT